MSLSVSRTLAVLSASALFWGACKKDNTPAATSSTITIENVLKSKPLVESGTFQNTGTSPIIFPAKSVTFSFYAGKGQYLSFACMYGWSNDLFFAPANPGIKLYNDDGTPATGDVSSQIKLWDNGTRVNQSPGSGVIHPGMAETTVKGIKEVSGTDDYNNTYLPAAQLIHASLAYNGNSQFTLTINNNSKGTMNETPFSPGVWAVSHLAGGNLIMPAPIFTANQQSANGLTNIAEMGNATALNTYLSNNTGTFTGLSPVLVVVYRGSTNPFYKEGEADRGNGLKYIAQMGNADTLASVLKNKADVKNVYVLKDPTTGGPLLPQINDAAGGKVSQLLSLLPGDKIAIATMFGSSNDWFFATKAGDVDGSFKGDASSYIGLFDDGTAVDQFPGANIRPAPAENKAINTLPNPNGFTTLPAVADMIKVTLQ